jgi:hypothetical protein
MSSKWAAIGENMAGINTVLVFWREVAGLR